MQKTTNIDGFTVRPDTLDEYVLKEVKTCYKHLTVKATDTIMNIGANVGAFEWYYADKVKKIVSYEPDPANFRLLKINTRSFDNVKIVRRAVISGEDETVSFFLNTKKNKGAHSLCIKRGREEITVKATNFSKILSIHKPSVVKIDIEGGEYELLKTKIPDCVERMAIEFHFGHKAWKDEYKVLLKKLCKKDGFKQTVPAKKEAGSAWYTMVYLNR